MKTQSMLVAALASAPSVLAHTVFTDYYVNGMPVVCRYALPKQIRLVLTGTRVTVSRSA